MVIEGYFDVLESVIDIIVIDIFLKGIENKCVVLIVMNKDFIILESVF